MSVTEVNETAIVVQHDAWALAPRKIANSLLEGAAAFFTDSHRNHIPRPISRDCGERRRA